MNLLKFKCINIKYKRLKVKLSLCLINEALYHEDVWGSGSIAVPVLILAADGDE
jgi:hypothetical protein